MTPFGVVLFFFVAKGIEPGMEADIELLIAIC